MISPRICHNTFGAIPRPICHDLIAISKKVAADENALDKDPESMSKKELEKHIGHMLCAFTLLIDFVAV